VMAAGRLCGVLWILQHQSGIFWIPPHISHLSGCFGLLAHQVTGRWNQTGH
jgi:hypothetical protein